MSEWFESEDFWRKLYPIMFPEGRFQSADEEVDKILALEVLASKFTAATSEVYPDGTMFVQRREIFDDWTRIRNEWLLIRNQQLRSFKLHHTLYSGQELKDRLSQAGFGNTQLYGDLDGSAYGTGSKLLIALARKEES